MATIPEWINFKDDLLQISKIKRISVFSQNQVGITNDDGDLKMYNFATPQEALDQFGALQNLFQSVTPDASPFFSITGISPSSVATADFPLNITIKGQVFDPTAGVTYYKTGGTIEHASITFVDSQTIIALLHAPTDGAGSYNIAILAAAGGGLSPVLLTVS